MGTCDPGSTSLAGIQAFSIVATRRSGRMSTVASTAFSLGVRTVLRYRRLNLSAHQPANCIGAGAGFSLGASIVDNDSPGCPSSSTLPQHGAHAQTEGCGRD